jgi:hypothetical protein
MPREGPRTLISLSQNLLLDYTNKCAIIGMYLSVAWCSLATTERGRAVSVFERQLRFVMVTEIELQPYTFHNVPVLALPPLLTYRFRYTRKRFLTDSGAPQGLLTMWGLLVLRDHTTNELIPVRECHVDSVDEQGDLIFLQLAFDRYVLYDDGLGEYSKALTEALARKGVRAEQDHFLERYVVEIPPEDLKTVRMQPWPRPADYAVAWQKLIEKLSKKRAFSGLRFFRIAGLFPVASDQAVSANRTDEAERGYTLSGGTTYEIDVVHRACDDPTPRPHEMGLYGSKEFFEFPKQTELVDGRYDKIGLMLYVKPQASRRRAAVLTFRSEQSVRSTQIPPIYLPLRITWPLRTYFLRLLPVFVALVGILIILNVATLDARMPVGLDFWRILGSMFIGYGIGSFSLFSDVLAPYLK